MFDIQGHRGARGLRPENTLAGFEYAIAAGVTTLELDTGISADGVVVVCHDPFINPKLCLNQRGDRLPSTARYLLHHLTLEEIQSYDCGCLNPDPVQFPDQQTVPGASIPTLQQVIDRAEAQNPEIRYNIESKVNPLQPEDSASPSVFAEKLVEIIVKNNLIPRATIQSFDWRVLQTVKCLNPAIQTSALVLHNQTASTLEIPDSPSPFLAGYDFQAFGRNLVALLKATQFIDVYSPNFETLLPESPYFLQPTSAFHQAGFPVIPWTVNTPSLMHRLIQLGVDGLITDFPDALVRLLKEQGLT
jgi:glycerophosphoryl diester phosphodiesterase